MRNTIFSLVRINVQTNNTWQIPKDLDLGHLIKSKYPDISILISNRLQILFSETIE